MPFRYVGGNWESFPISKYLDLLSVRLDDALKTLKNTSLPFAPQDRAAWQKGVVLANQAFAISMFVGQNRMAVVDNSPIKRKAEKADETVKKIGKDIVGTVLETIADEAVDGLFGEGATSTDKKLVAIGKLFGKENTPIKFSPRIEKADAIASGASTAMTVAALGLTLASLFSSDQAGDIMEAVTASMEIIGNVVETGITVAKVINQSAKVGFTQALRSVTALSRAAKIGMVVGVVLSVALSAGLFIAQWASGAFGITDLAFTSALAGVIAAVIVAVIMVAIASIPIVGQIIAAVIAIIDAVIAGICAISKAAGYDLEKATTYEIPRSGGAKLALCEGISGFLAQGIKFLLFSQTSLVGNMQSKDRLTTSNFQLGFRDPGKGFQVGNSIQPSLTVDNKIKLADQPFDWKSLAYFWQFNWDNLDDATFRYDLSPDKSKRNVSTGQMESEWQEYDPNTHNLTGGHRSPGIQYDDPLTMVPVEAELAEGTSAITFQSAGINVPVPLYLRESYANPVQECWIYPTLPVPIPICYIRSGDKGTNHIDLQLKFDIFPATLDEFYQPAAVDGGYSLAWGQSGKVTFPKMRDFDGDGLLSPAFGGTDPDDRLWDADGDGLGDTFEMQKGTNPRQADTDDDGIDDRQELILGSNPLKADGDGDGLLDGQEVFHQGRDSTWSGGWEFVYDIVDGVSQATWVASDPTRWNSDTDTLSDAQEKIYGLNPNAVSDPTILKMASQVRETNAPVTLLRFDERAGAVAFSDSSGLANNATCSGDTCPAAGHEGKYINGLIFDGVDDFVTSAEAFPLANHSFTVAAWVRRDATNASHAIFSIGDSRNPLLIGFRNDNSFICAFGKALVSSVIYTDTGWHHWACTYDAATKQRVIYRDGWMVASDTTSPYQGSGSWIIGKSFGGWQFNGALDEVAVVPAALDILQIGSLMDGRYNPGGAQVTTAPGEWLTYEAKLENNLLGKSLVGLLSVNTPPGWFSAVNPTTYFLNPAQTQTLQGNLMIDGAAASGTYNLSLTAGAAAVPVPSPQPPSSSQKPKFSPPTNGLVARWAFEYNGDDLSGHNSHASLNAGASYVPAFKGAGINLNGSGNYVSVPQAVANT
ncbi:MAG: LamG domain-containing protein, partial [Anaerolineae bacterium]